MISDSGMRSRLSFAILNDFDTNFLASVLSTFKASSWNNLFECSPKNMRRNCITTNLIMKSPYSLFCRCFSLMKCMNCRMSSGTSRFKDAKMRVTVSAAAISRK